MKLWFIIPALVLASACVSNNSDVISAAPIAYVSRDILPPDLETAGGEEDEVFVDSSDINLYIDQQTEE